MKYFEIREKKREIQARLNDIEVSELDIQKRIGQQQIARDTTGQALSKENIKAAIEKITDKIINDPKIKNPVLLGVMDGGMPFFHDLMEALNNKKYLFQFATIQSINNDGIHSVASTIQPICKVDLANRHVLVIDDLCGRARAYKEIRQWAVDLQPRPLSIRLICLVNKIQKRSPELEPYASAFHVSKNLEYAGYGLDFSRLARNLSHIVSWNSEELPISEEMKGLSDEKAQLKKHLAVMEAEEAPHAATFLQRRFHSMFVNKKLKQHENQIPVTNLTNSLSPT